ncbi:division/cell wall cluster transcriptional repressor MraZ [Candidatus Cloacimonadota bacterium]
MSGEFLGTYENSVNKQKWITIPANFKKKFSPMAKLTVIVTIGPEENIAVYPLDNWDDKIDQLKKGETRERSLLDTLRSFAGSEQRMEANGRIRISNELLEIAGIEDKVIIKGEGNYISVWNPTSYLEYRKKKLENHRNTFNSLDYQ